jgi:hypothetical protein
LSKATPLARIPVGVVVERRPATSPWIDFVWRPAGVLAGTPDAKPWTRLSEQAEAELFFAGAMDMELHRSETGNYRDNLNSGTPALWVVLRPTGVEPPYELVTVTADPSEGEAFTEPGTDLVEPVPMPEAIYNQIAAFVTEHHVERVFFKRRRDRQDPEALGRRTRAGDEA